MLSWSRQDEFILTELSASSHYALRNVIFQLRICYSNTSIAKNGSLVLYKYLPIVITKNNDTIDIW